MTKIDNSYLEKLGEVLYDDNKAVNYKVVSMMFGVHVNIAKQMLYHFYKTEKAKGKNIYATYYVSGMLPRKMLSKLGEGSEESPSSQEISDELESYLVLICKDEKLEEMKTHFTKIFSVHVYSLTAFPLENYDALENLSAQRLSDEEGRTPVNFGPIICSASQKLIENHVVARAPTVKKTEPVSRNKSAQESKPKTSSNEKSTTVTEKKPETDAKKERPKVKPPQGADKNRIKNMFATAATKPKVEKKPEPEIKAQSNVKSYKELKSAMKKRDRESDSRKRKRVQDIFSSSSEESDAEKDSDVEECLPESPIPSKRSNQIVSDSEEEDEDDSEKVTVDSESEALPESPTVNNSKSNSSSSKNVPNGKGRRRVLKTVTKNFLDGEGYLVTKREQVLVSEDEEETGPAVDEKEEVDDPVKPPPLKKAKDETKLSTQNSVNKSLNNSKSKSSVAPAKTKQASLMSFFKKK